MWTSKPSEEVKFANSIDPSSLLKFSGEVGCLRIESTFYPWYAVFSLHFTLSLHFTPGLQSAFHTSLFLAAVLSTGKRVALSSRLQCNYLLKNSVKSLRFCGKWSNLIYIISSVMHTFWLVLTYDLLEERRIDDVIIKTFFNSLLYKTNRFQVAVRLFSNRSYRTSKCGKNISDTLGCADRGTVYKCQHKPRGRWNPVT